MATKTLSLEDAIKQAQSLIGAGRFDECISLCQSILNEAPQQKSARNIMALSLFQSGHQNEGIAELSTLFQQNPNDGILTANLFRMIRLAQAFEHIPTLLEQLSPNTLKRPEDQREVLSCLQLAHEQAAADLRINIQRLMLAIQPENLSLFLKQSPAPDAKAIQHFLQDHPLQDYAFKGDHLPTLSILHDLSFIEEGDKSGAFLISNAHVETRHMVVDSRFNIKGLFYSSNSPTFPLTGDVIFNAIADPDQSHDLLIKLENALKNKASRILNPPHQVLKTTREQVYERIKDLEGIKMPQTLRFTKSKRPELTDFPKILRPIGSQGGTGLIKIDSPQALEDELNKGEEDEYYLGDFVDFKSGDGLYRKQRVFFIGDQIIPMHKIIHRSWKIHAHDRDHLMLNEPELMAEELSFVQSHPKDVRFDKIKKIMELDVFGMDYAELENGDWLIFEINACMHSYPRAHLIERFPLLAIPARRQREAFLKLVGLN